MSKKKKWFSLLVVGISIFGASTNISHLNKHQIQKQISSKFAKSKEQSKENNNSTSVVSNNKKCVFCDQLVNKAISSQLNSASRKYLKQMVLLTNEALNQEERIDKLSREIILFKQESENNSSLEQLELLKQKKKQLEGAWNKQKLIKLKQQKLKNVLLGASVGGVIVAGITAGLGSFFGLRNINTKINNKISELKDNISYLQDEIKEVKSKDSLFTTLKKLLEISLNKNLPTAIFQIIDTTLLKTVLKDYVTNSTSSELKNILQNNIKETISKLIDELLNKIESIKLEDEEESDDFSKIIKDVQSKIAEVIKSYLPSFISGVINFLVKIDNGSTSDKKGRSIIVLLIEKLLKHKHIIIQKPDNLAKLLESYFSVITMENNNDLIKFIVDQFSNVIEKHTISFNIIDDFFEIINEVIAKLLTKDTNKNQIDIDIIFKNLIPKLLNVVTKSVDSIDSNELLEFINGIFEDVENDNKPKWIYQFINTNENHEENKDYYLSLPSTNKNKTNTRKIHFPKFSFNLSTIISSIFSLSDIQNIVEKFLTLFIKPISKLLSDESKKEDAKKALFRISSIFVYFYYKYAGTGSNIADTIISFINPLDPESLVKKIIEQNIKTVNQKTIKLTDIFGEEKSRQWWEILYSTSYKIFELSKEAASNKMSDNNKKTQLKNNLKKGMYQSEAKSK